MNRGRHWSLRLGEQHRGHQLPQSSRKAPRRTQHNLLRSARPHFDEGIVNASLASYRTAPLILLLKLGIQVEFRPPSLWRGIAQAAEDDGAVSWTPSP
jgi:hypothetical protein